jgi:hypothetical protein
LRVMGSSGFGDKDALIVSEESDRSRQAEASG